LKEKEKKMAESGSRDKIMPLLTPDGKITELNLTALAWTIYNKWREAVESVLLQPTNNLSTESVSAFLLLDKLGIISNESVESALEALIKEINEKRLNDLWQRVRNYYEIKTP